MSNISSSRLYHFEDYKKLVSGFVRDYEKLITVNIPQVITTLCLLFYYLKSNEYFETFHSCFRAAKEKTKYLMAIKDIVANYTVYGSVVISPSDHYDHYWVFNISTSAMGARCGIGLDDVTSIWLNSHFFEHNTKHYAYVIVSCVKEKCYITSHDMRKKQGFNDFDVTASSTHLVIMKLASGCLSYVELKNRKKYDLSSLKSYTYKLAFDNIDLNANYKMAVSVFGGRGRFASISLIDYYFQQI
eukprot:349580_1